MLKVSTNCNTNTCSSLSFRSTLFTLSKNVLIVMFESLELTLMTFHNAYKILATGFTLEN